MFQRACLETQCGMPNARRNDMKVPTGLMIAFVLLHPSWLASIRCSRTVLFSGHVKMSDSRPVEW